MISNPAVRRRARPLATSVGEVALENNSVTVIRHAYLLTDITDLE